MPKTKSQVLEEKRLYQQERRKDPAYREKQRLYQEQRREDAAKKEEDRIKRETKRRLAGVPTKEERFAVFRDEFVSKANVIHNNQYVYTNVEYKTSHTKVKILCQTHGQFLQTPHAHLAGQGCPDCANIQRSLFYRSKGEILIEQYLLAHNIPFETQKMFSDCKHVFQLRYDFYLPTLNTLIEYDGLQHFQFVKRFHKTEEGFKSTQFRDKIKEQFAKDNNIPLLRISYKQQKDIATLLSNLVSPLLL